MLWFSKSESGQISILTLVSALAMLGATCLVGALAQVLVAQQRLNSSAEAIALVGAQELEFNQAGACDVAKEFSTVTYGLIADCILQPQSIYIELTKPNSNRYFASIFPNIYASSRAGIAIDN